MQRLFFISCFVLVAFAAHSQTPTFTFECFCGTLTPADTTCDICNTSTQSRYFKGLLIRKNGAAFKWIEEPYTVIQNFTALTFKELIPNAEQIRIELSGTQWTTIEGFRDSVQCPCAGGSVTLVPGPGISIYGDTISSIPQQIDTFDIVGGDTLRISLERDSVPFHFVILPPDSDTSGYNYSFDIDGDSLCITDGAGTFCVDVSQFFDNTDTSGYNLDFRISGDTLYVTDGASTKFVNLLPYKDNTDAQTLSIDSVTITAGRRFALSISNGNTIYFEDRDNQQIDTFSISGQVVSLSVQRDGQPAKTITIPTADGSETIVTGANGVQVTGNGTSGTPYVVAPPTGSDTQTLRYSGTTLTANSALTNNGAQIGINNAPDASYRLKVKQSTDTDGIAVERSSSTSKILLYHNANGILKTNANNMFFESAGVIALYPAGGGFISQVSINSQSPITVASGNSGLLRLDATYSPTAAGGDFGFLKIYPNVNQTSAADQPIFGVDINPNLISLQGQLYGVRYWPSVGRYLFQPNGDTVSSHFRGRLGIGLGTTDPVRRLHVVGDMRLTGSIDTPTAVMGRDADGDVANLALSGLSIVTGTLTATDPSTTNEIQRLDTFDIVSNTLRASLLNDAVPFSSVDLSPYLDNTDNQVVDTFDIVANTLRLSIEADGQPFKSVSLAPYLDNTDAQTLSIDSTTISAGRRFALSISGGNTVNFEDRDSQQIDTFSISGQVVSLSVQRDGQPAKTITLPTADGSETIVTAGTGIGVSGNGTSGTPYIISNTGDLSNTNEIQRLDTFEIVANILRASLLNDAVPFSSVNLAPYLDNTDDQVVDTFQIVSNVLRLSLESDGQPFKSVDLSPYVAQTLNSTGDATSHTATLSGSGGSLKIKEGANITLATDATGLNGEVTISATPTSDGNGIYGDGVTPGSGSDNLPPGGSTVTIPGQYQPLNFAIDANSGGVWTGVQVTTDYSSDDAGVNYFVGRAPQDSFYISAYDNRTRIETRGAGLDFLVDGTMNITADSVSMATVPARTIGSAILALHSGNFVRKISGSSVGHILKWDGTNWVLGTDNTGSGTVDGAENGLNVASNKVRLGGTLLATTTIDLATFPLRLFNGKFSHQQYSGFSYTPTQPAGFSGIENNPTTGASPTSDGIAEFTATSSGGSTQPNSLTIGAFSTDNTGVWMQARSLAVPNFYYPLALNPNGGNVGVGTSTTAAHSTLQSGGSFAAAYLETVGAPTFDATKHTVIYTANTNISWTLPSAASCACAGRVYILNHSGTAGTITLSQNVSKGGGSTFNTLTAGQWAYIVYGSSAIRGYKLASL